MAADAFINCRVTSETKALVRALADRQGITESALVKELLGVVLQEPRPPDQSTPQPSKVNRIARLSVRLEPADWMLLKERANTRRIPSATYVSLLVRSHLRAVAPLPKAEYLALKQSVTELTAIGRNLNEISRGLRQGQHPTLPDLAQVGAMLKVAVQLRDHVRALLTANERSWADGHSQTSH